MLKAVLTALCKNDLRSNIYWASPKTCELYKLPNKFYNRPLLRKRNFILSFYALLGLHGVVTNYQLNPIDTLK